MKIEVERTIAAPRDAVWAMYTDHAGWTRWAGLGRVRLHRPGDEEPNGVGAVRIVPGNIHEEVVAFEPPSRMAYRVVRGLPIRNHLGEVTFQEVGGGTRIRWAVDMEMRIPGSGALTAAIVRATFGRVLKRLDQKLAGA